MRCLYKSFLDFEQVPTEHPFDLMNKDLERIIIWTEKSKKNGILGQDTYPLPDNDRQMSAL